MIFFGLGTPSETTRETMADIGIDESKVQFYTPANRDDMLSNLRSMLKSMPTTDGEKAHPDGSGYRVVIPLSHDNVDSVEQLSKKVNFHLSKVGVSSVNDMTPEALANVAGISMSSSDSDDDDGNDFIEYKSPLPEPQEFDNKEREAFSDVPDDEDEKREEGGRPSGRHALPDEDKEDESPISADSAQGDAEPEPRNDAPEAEDVSEDSGSGRGNDEPESGEVDTPAPVEQQDTSDGSSAEESGDSEDSASEPPAPTRDNERFQEGSYSDSTSAFDDSSDSDDNTASHQGPPQQRPQRPQRPPQGGGRPQRPPQRQGGPQGAQRMQGRPPQGGQRPQRPQRPPQGGGRPQRPPQRQGGLDERLRDPSRGPTRPQGQNYNSPRTDRLSRGQRDAQFRARRNQWEQGGLIPTGGQSRVIVFTGAGGGVGKSTAAITYANAALRIAKKHGTMSEVWLIETDYRSSKFAYWWNLPESKTLAPVLRQIQHRAETNMEFDWEEVARAVIDSSMVTREGLRVVACPADQDEDMSVKYLRFAISAAIAVASNRNGSIVFLDGNQMTNPNFDAIEDKIYNELVTDAVVVAHPGRLSELKRALNVLRRYVPQNNISALINYVDSGQASVAADFIAPAYSVIGRFPMIPMIHPANQADPRVPLWVGVADGKTKRGMYAMAVQGLANLGIPGAAAERRQIHRGRSGGSRR